MDIDLKGEDDMRSWKHWVTGILLVGVSAITWHYFQAPRNVQGYVLWNSVSANEDRNIVCYSLNTQQIVAQTPGSMIACQSDENILCYEHIGDRLFLYKVGPELNKELFMGLSAPDYSRIVGWANDALFYIKDDLFMKMDAVGRMEEVIRLKGNDVYSVMPQLSSQGIWVYFYQTADGYTITVFDSNGVEIAVFDGLHPSWYGEDTLLYKPSVASDTLKIFNAVTMQSSIFTKDNQQPHRINYSLLNTTAITIDRQRNWLAYTDYAPWRFMGFTTDYPQSQVIYLVNLHSGTRLEIKLPKDNVELPYAIELISMST